MPTLLRRARSSAAWRRTRRVLTAVALVLGLGVVASAFVRYPRHDLPVGSAPGVWRGAFHVHTTASDGAGTLEEVAREAAAAGVRWVVVTDHNRMDHGGSRYVDGVLVVHGVEVGTLWGHAVALGVPRALTREERRAETSLELIHSLGGTIVASHPVGPRRPFRRLDAPQLDGIEVISGDTMWREVVRSPLRLTAGLLALPLNRTHAVMQMVRRPDRGLEAWDHLLAQRDVPGFFSHDAHGLPSYDVPFRVMATYARVGRPPTGDPRADGAALTAALIEGRTYFGVDALAAAGFVDFHALTRDGRRVEAGQSVPLEAAPVLRLHLPFRELPRGMTVSLRVAGRVIRPEARAAGDGLLYEHRVTAAGAYRVEVIHDGALTSLPWVLTNPVLVRE